LDFGYSDHLAQILKTGPVKTDGPNYLLQKESWQEILSKSDVNMEINLYNKVPDQIKVRENFNSFKKDFKCFLLRHCFYSLDEFMSF
jgi:hypothetical protein